MNRTLHVRWRPASAALVALGLFFGLGMLVRGAPSSFDQHLEMSIVGSIPSLAVFMTELGLMPWLLRFGVALLLLAIISPLWRARALFSVATLALAHLTSDFAKNLFHRARPDNWIGVHETSFAYPSGHAASAAAFFGLWTYWILSDTQLAPRPRALLGGACGGVAYGICWSRLALGAHWPTDVLGGLLLGVGIVCGAYALVGSPVPLEEELLANLD